MIQIQNKKTSIKDGEKELQYSDLLKIVTNSPMQGGFGFHDMKIRLKITDVLEKAAEAIHFEDADYAYLKPLVTNMKWNGISKDVISMTEDFLAAEKREFQPIDIKLK